MATRVFDASALAAVVFDEPETTAIAPLLRDGPGISPTLLSHEMANICATKLRRRPEAAEVTRRAFDLFKALRIEEMPVDISACLDLARLVGLSAYDASYLWLARRMGVELVTLDKKLARAAAAV